MRRPGLSKLRFFAKRQLFEPGPPPWQGEILPLDYRRNGPRETLNNYFLYKTIDFELSTSAILSKACEGDVICGAPQTSEFPKGNFSA